MIEDFALFATGVVFAVSLVPTIWHQWRIRRTTVPLVTSLLTTGALVVNCLAFTSLGLDWSASIAGVVAIEWAAIMGQGLWYARQRD
jgi:hypothetical protein